MIAVAPATFNTINAWALGITRDFVVGVVAEGIGTGIPRVAMPCVNADCPSSARRYPPRGAKVTVLPSLTCDQFAGTLIRRKSPG